VRVATLLDAVLERKPAERAAYLSEACAGDESLAAEVEDLLAGALRSSFLDSKALVVAGPLLEPTEFTEESAPGGLPYELERQLGRGGTATVYLARDAKHDRQVAIKVLAGDLTASLGAQRFAREIRLTARLQHPHILALLDSGVFGADAGVFRGRPYYVMPYVDGESLRARLARGDTFGIDEALRVLREVADALRYAHEQGVVHRDIKPENILFSREHAVVADFGIAKALVASQNDEDSEHGAKKNSDGTVTQLSSLMGTPAYMAPEQAAGDASLDHRADLYAWGVVAYELLAGRHPVGHEMISPKLRAARARRTPEPLRKVAPAVPPEVAALVMRCLARSPAERPGSAADVVAVLERAAILPMSKKAQQIVRVGRSLRAMAALGLLVLVIEDPHRGHALVVDRELAASELIGRLRVALNDLPHLELAMLFVGNTASRDTIEHRLARVAAMADSLKHFQLPTYSQSILSSIQRMETAASMEYTARLSLQIKRANSISSKVFEPALNHADSTVRAAEHALRARVNDETIRISRTATWWIGSLAFALVLAGLIAYRAVPLDQLTRTQIGHARRRSWRSAAQHRDSSRTRQ